MQLKWLLVWTGIFLSTYHGMAKGVELTKKIDFDIGQKHATLHGVVQGFEKINYQFYASKGQSLHVSMDSSKAYLKIYSPFKNSSDTPSFKGETEGSFYNGKLKRSGIYTLQVYLIYDEARRDMKSLYVLEVSID
ncbi:MAG TPA: hypothetical protein ENJ34_01450 [Epsilonproteobacteria bacterium]|nr:hypothetical protein [Campylobacterota bacterium]